MNPVLVELRIAISDTSNHHTYRAIEQPRPLEELVFMGHLSCTGNLFGEELANESGGRFHRSALLSVTAGHPGRPSAAVPPVRHSKHDNVAAPFSA